MIFRPKSISVTIQGDVTKETFRGDFLVKTMLSHADQFTIARRKKELLGNNSISDLPLVLQQKALILSELSARIIQAPPWYGNGEDLMDNNLIVAIFEAAIEAEEEAMKKLNGEGKEAKKDLEKIVENATKTEVIVPENK